MVATDKKTAIRIMSLEGIGLKEGYEIVQGIHLPKGDCNYKRVNLGDFAFIWPHNRSEEEMKITWAYEYESKEHQDLYREILIDNVVEENSVDEDRIMLIIIKSPALAIRTNANRIAGRYYNDGVYILSEGDSIILRHTDKTYEYVAVKVRNEMHLVQMY